MPEAVISQILIISDAVRLRDSLRVMLKSYFPHSAIDEIENGVMAFQQLAEAPKLLVLIDASLPDGDAWKLFEEFKNQFPLHDYVVLTHSLEHRKRALEIDAKEIALDGFTAEDLYDAVKSSVKD